MEQRYYENPNHAKGWKRLVATSIDQMILMILSFCFIAAFEDQAFLPFVGPVFAAILILAYDIVSLSLFSQTPGMKLLGIKLVNQDMTKPDLCRIVYRNSLEITFYFLVIMEHILNNTGVISFSSNDFLDQIPRFIMFMDVLSFWGDPGHRTLHDKLAKTFVVRLPEAKKNFLNVSDSTIA